jgi:hypothetical protein
MSPDVLAAPSEQPLESPETAEEKPERARAVPQSDSLSSQTAPQRPQGGRSLWRRIFGG